MAEAPPSAATAPAPGAIYTFYSYKGGVGRSMALVNVGVLLALAGKRVLLIDWDLEAPGLEMYFRHASRLVGDPERVPGVVDLLEARRAGKILPWRQCLLRAEFLGKSLDLISAGKRTPDYRQRVQQLDWDSLYQEHLVGNFVDELRDEWRAAYDFVLVDSRTGITDIGDICTVLLPDVLVLMFVTNYQNVEGVKQVMGRAVAARNRLPVNRAKLHAVPLPARDEVYNEYEKSLEWKRIYARELGDLYREWLPRGVTPEEVLNKLFIPYVTNWSFGERIPVLENAQETQNPTAIGAAYQRVANLLANGLDWYSLEAKVGVEDLQAAQLELLREKERSRRTRRTFAAILVSVLLLLAAAGYWGYTRTPQSTELIDGRNLFEANKTEEALKVFEARAALLEGKRKRSPDDPLLLGDIDTNSIWLGDALVRLGRLNDALAAFRTGRSALERVLSKSPDDQQAQRDLSVSHHRIGGVLEAQGKLEEALASYRSDKAIMDKLTAKDPSNTDWQADLVISHHRIGGVLQAQGKLEEALASYRSAKGIMDKLTAQDPSNTDWQSELSVSHHRIGSILEAQGKLEEALASQRSYRAIMDKLTAQDPSNTGWQRELSVGHHRIGRILEAQGKLEEALASYRSDKAIMDKLTAQDPSNAGWQSDLAVTHRRMSGPLQAQGKLAEALKELAEARRILTKLGAATSGNAQWSRDLVEVLRLEASVQKQAGQAQAALNLVEEGLKVLRQSKIEPGAEAFWQPETARLLTQRGEILQTLGDRAGAARDFAEARTLLVRLLKLSPGNAEWKRDLARLDSLQK